MEIFETFRGCFVFQSRVSTKTVVISYDLDWFAGLSVPSVIDQSDLDYFGFGFATHNGKSL